MNQQETQTIEQALDKLNEIITALTAERTELSYRISQLENTKAELTKLLPHDKRIDRLFG